MIDHLSISAGNFFTAGPTDRLAGCRRDPHWLPQALRAPATRFALVWREHSLVFERAGRACLLRAAELPEGLQPELDAVLLGDLRPGACFAIELEAEADALEALLPRGASFRDLRAVGGLIAAADGALLAYARAMLYWHRRHRHCGECGAPTESREAGHLRVCTDARCAARHFPRTDPAVIVLAIDASGARCLLGRQASWAPGVYSCLAGFVEPGESLEQAVVREVREEAGVRILRAEYRSSQPWPFPSSLMLGFHALAASDDVRSEDDELEHARWVSRAQLAAGIAAGTLLPPRRISIAYRLIEEWYDRGGGRLASLLEHA